MKEQPPPTRYGRTKRGTHFYVIHLKESNRAGQKLYQLRFLGPGILGGNLYTATALRSITKTWLRQPPSEAMLHRERSAEFC